MQIKICLSSTEVRTAVAEYVARKFPGAAFDTEESVEMSASNSFYRDAKRVKTVEAKINGWF